MAGDWIKVEHVTMDKPEVYQIAEHLEIDPDAVLGKLFRVWVWADQQSRDGHVVGVTKKLLDRLAGVTGFGDALLLVGWLQDSEDGLSFSNFDRHNGESSKKRALARNRKRIARETRHAGVTSASRNERDRSATREEKSERDITPPSRPPQKPPKDEPALDLSGVDSQAWAEFDAYRQSSPKLRSGWSAIAKTKAANLLRPLKPQEQRDVVDYSIVGGYTGLFPDRVTRNEASKRNSQGSAGEKHADVLDFLDQKIQGAT